MINYVAGFIMTRGKSSIEEGFELRQAVRHNKLHEHVFDCVICVRSDVM